MKHQDQYNLYDNLINLYSEYLIYMQKNGHLLILKIQTKNHRETYH